jgi:hypothetical protein
MLPQPHDRGAPGSSLPGPAESAGMPFPTSLTRCPHPGPTRRTGREEPVCRSRVAGGNDRRFAGHDPVASREDARAPTSEPLSSSVDQSTVEGCGLMGLATLP